MAQLAVLLCPRTSVIGGAILLWIERPGVAGRRAYVLTSYYIIHATCAMSACTSTTCNAR
jgi:ATP-binding cassette subfamily B protein